MKVEVLQQWRSVLFGLGVWLVSAPSFAWVETHLISDDVRVEVDRSGSAIVDHGITMRIQGGPLRSFDLVAADADVVPLGDGMVISAQTEKGGSPIPLQVVPRPDGGLRVNVESGRGLSRGIFLFHVRYRKNLLAGDNIRRDGAMVRVRWTGPVWQEGHDNARCSFVLPAAPTEPRPPGAAVNGENDDESDDAEIGVFLSDVKRSADRDEVELIRPHVARSEAVTWSVRVDPRAFDAIEDPRLRPPPPPAPPKLVPVEQRAAYAAAAGALLLGFSVLVACKARQVHRHARGIAQPRALVPIPTSLRILFSGPLLALGIALQLKLEDPWWGTLLVLLAMALTWYLPPTWHLSPRGPGRWLPLADREAFAKPTAPRDAWLDTSTSKGRIFFGLSLVASVGATYVASRVSAYGAYLVAFNSAAFVPLFGTGRLRELRPHPLSGPGPILRRVAEKLRGVESVRAIAWARLPTGSAEFDELRVLCAPKVPLRGFIAIEVGLVMAPGLGGCIYLPEVLVRVVDASPCHEAFLRLLPGSRWVRGRRADERVMIVRPRLPTVTMTGALARRLLARAAETAPPTIRRADVAASASVQAAGTPRTRMHAPLGRMPVEGWTGVARPPSAEQARPIS